jgi:tetratricopeptide (TPR) repeat protein
MQTHGFLRIYDAKYKSFGVWTARLDQLMCLSWFGFGVIFSQSRVHYILQSFYGLGGPQIPVAWIDALRTVWAPFTAVVTLAFLVNLVRNWRAGRPVNPIKLVLLTTSISFWLYCTMVVGHLLVGVLMFEIFHDVQYLSIVWAFNRRRALGDPEGIGNFTRTLFGTRKVLIGVYVGLVLAYGALYFVEKPIHDWTPIFGGFLGASALLHFYYDGFIWKVRERSTRKALGIEGGQDQRKIRELVPGLKHALRWSPFVAAVVAIAVFYAHPAMKEAEAWEALGSAFPNYDLAQQNLGVARYLEGDLDGAITANRRTLELDPADEDMAATARTNLGWALVERSERHVAAGAPDVALPLLHEALGIDPNFPDMESDKATELLKKGDVNGALLKYQVALLMAPEHPRVHMNLALALAASGRFDDALGHARAAQRVLPQDPAVAQLVQRLEQANAGR